MKLGILLALALGLAAGCPMKSSSSGGSTMPRPNGGGGDPAGGGGGGAGDGWVIAPNVMGKTLDEARAIAKAAGFTSEVEEGNVACQDEANDPGKINCQDPQAGQRVRTYAMIKVNVYTPRTIKGAIVRSQLEKIKGMTVPEAKKYLAQFGFDGKIIVHTLQQHIANCERDHICSMDSESGIGIHDDLSVYFNLMYDPPSE